MPPTNVADDWRERLIEALSERVNDAIFRNDPKQSALRRTLDVLEKHKKFD